MARTNKQYSCKIPLLPPYRRNPSARDQSFPSLPWAGSRGEDPLLCVCSLSAISITNNQRRVSRTLLRLWLSQWHYSTQNFLGQKVHLYQINAMLWVWGNILSGICAASRNARSSWRWRGFWQKDTRFESRGRIVYYGLSEMFDREMTHLVIGSWL